MLSRFNNSSLSTKVTLINSAGIVLVVLAVAIASVLTVESAMRDQAQDRQEANMRVAWEVLQSKGKDIRIADGTMFAGEHGINDSFELVDRVKDLVGGTATIFMNDRRVSTNVIKPDGSRAVGTLLAKGPVYDALFKQGRPYRGEADILGSKYFTAYDPIKSASGQVIGVLYVGLKQNEFMDIVADVRNRLVLVAVVAGLLALFAGLVFVRRQMQPVIQMADVVERLQDNDLTVEIPAQDRCDEIGTLAKAIRSFKESKAAAEKVAEQQRKEQDAQTAHARRIEELCKAFDATSAEAVKSVAVAAGQMQSSSESMNTTAEETTRQSAAVAAASEQASANVETVATAAEELSASISEISRQVSQASQIASGAVQQAEQTNLKVQGLADAGKGFAVVASEVKNLANQTAKATEEIGTQIGGIQTATREAVAAIEEIGKTISEIDQVNSSIASAVEQQGAATQEIARNVEQAAAGTHEVSTNIGGVSQAANDTGAAAGQIHSAADELSKQSEALRAEVDKFLANVRAA